MIKFWKNLFFPTIILCHTNPTLHHISKKIMKKNLSKLFMKKNQNSPSNDRVNMDQEEDVPSVPRDVRVTIQKVIINAGNNPNFYEFYYHSPSCYLTRRWCFCRICGHWNLWEKSLTYKCNQNVIWVLIFSGLDANYLIFSSRIFLRNNSWLRSLDCLYSSDVYRRQYGFFRMERLRYEHPELSKYFLMEISFHTLCCYKYRCTGCWSITDGQYIEYMDPSTFYRSDHLLSLISWNRIWKEMGNKNRESSRNYRWMYIDTDRMQHPQRTSHRIILQIFSFFL